MTLPRCLLLQIGMFVGFLLEFFTDIDYASQAFDEKFVSCRLLAGKPSGRADAHLPSLL